MVGAPGSYKLMQSNKGTRTRKAERKFKDFAESGGGT